jgi:LysM repeat protein
MNYYAEFLAAVEVYKNYPQYFGELTLDKPDSPPYKSSTVKESNLSAKSKDAVVTTKYKVKNGDTLSDIAQRFGMPTRNLMDRNKLKKPVIYTGQILLVKQSVHRRNGDNTISTSRLNRL